MIKDEYSPYKIIHNYDKLVALKNGTPVAPLQIQMVPANVCNQRCTFCAYRMKDYLSNETFDDRQILDYNKIIETLDCMKDMGVGAIQYTGGGEPLVHPRITDIFKNTIERNIEMSLVSNGMALTEEQCELLGENASWVRISVDSATPEVYGFIRNVNQKSFHKVIHNIETLMKYKKGCVVGVGFVVEKENYKQIFDAAKLFKSIGVDNFRISAAFTPIGFSYFDEILSEAKELSNKAQELSDDNFTVFNLFNDRVKDTFEGTQNYDFCPIKELLTYIGADYNVYTCCTLAYNNNGIVGSIKDQSFKELWNSQVKTDMFKNHNPSNNCKHPCMYKGKNDFINYCTKSNPQHINFI